MIYATLRKNPTAKLDFSVNYAPWLASGVTISSSAWTVPSGLNEVSESNTTTTATVILSGGTEGKIYEVVNDVILSSATMTDRRVLKIIVPTADYNDAYNELSSLVEADTTPTLTESELNELLLSNEQASIWSSETDYEIGAVVIPSNAKRTGLRYRLISLDGSGLTSGLTEPLWPIGPQSIISDGNLVWIAEGSEYSLWNVESAARKGWLKKAAKAVPMIDVAASSGVRASASQIHKHCLLMADQFRSRKATRLSLVYRA
jgi:hypothetical protein